MWPKQVTDLIPNFAPDDPGGGGADDDVNPDIDVNEPPEQTGELDLSAPLFAMTGEDGQEVTLTGQEAIDRLSRLAELEGKYGSLEQELAALRAQPPQRTPQPSLERQPQSEDPVVQLRNTAKEALTAFANGDMDKIDTILDVLGQFAETRAQATSSAYISEQQRDQLFSAAHPDAADVVANPAELRAYMAKNPYLADPVQGFLAFKLDKAQKEIAGLKSQVAEAGNKGRQEGEKKTLDQLKARGGIRILQGGGSARPAGGNKAATGPISHDQMLEGALASIAQLRGGSLGD